MAANLYRRRRRSDFIAKVLCYAAALFGLTWLVLIVVALIKEGFSGISLQVFTEWTQPTGSPTGGLQNAIIGSLIMSGLGVFFGAPIGLLAGTYLAEYGRGTRLANIVRFINDILLSAPSIVIGLFIYQILVAHVIGHYSAWAGSVALAVIVIPVVVRTTEDMLLLVPGALREAGAALGMPRVFVIKRIAYRAARAGLITGVLLATARISGETAPLIFTSLNNQFGWSWQTPSPLASHLNEHLALLRPVVELFENIGRNMSSPTASLPAVILQFAQTPYQDWHKLAWTGALLITLAVLAISIGARVFGAQRTGK